MSATKPEVECATGIKRAVSSRMRALESNALPGIQALFPDLRSLESYVSK